MSQLKLKILVTRTDRLGDALLSLPTLCYLRKALPDAEIHFLAKSEIGGLLAGFMRDHYIKPIEVELKQSSLLQEALKAERYRVALFLYPEWELLSAAFLARVPKRVAPLSKWWSFLLLNHGVRQNRSRLEKNEAEYNLDLAKYVVSKVVKSKETPTIPRLEIPVHEAGAARAKEVLAAKGIPEDFILLHPGMGGSALNLDAQGYAEWIPELESQYSMPVVLSKGPAEKDHELVESIRKERPDQKILSNLKLVELMECLRLAKLVVAPSTGPLHLAHYVGTDTLGVYSPRGTERPERWAPWGGTGNSRILLAEASDRRLKLGLWREQIKQSRMLDPVGALS
ncbi:MAG: glycosyltransferase family 9 protein [Bdellovibrionaceae bacterium]|nr:glycosyltransferase family 9 protein [Pseudobdellovibrionaceae bacterium]